MSSWDYERPPRLNPERDIENRLARMYVEHDGVLSVRQQVQMAGMQRADIVLIQKDGDGRRYTVVEVKANAANLVHLRQLLRYMSHLKLKCDEGTKVSGIIAAPRFTAELLTMVDGIDPNHLALERTT